jgi:peptide deformylase
MDLVPYTDPILRKQLDRFDFESAPRNPVELYNELGTKLVELGGLGLAANQVGWPHRLFVIHSNPIKGFFNPSIVDTSEEDYKAEEGCLTIPGLILKVRRPRKIRLRYTEPNGNVKTEVFDGLTARIVQHELDHVNGVLFTTKVSRLELELAIKRSKQPYIIGDIT